MVLSDSTIAILKNFSVINSSLLVKPGNVIATVSPQKTVMAKATVPETFPKQFAIYELNRFIGTLSLFKDPELNFDIDDHFVRIVSGKSKTNYTFADPSMIVSPPEKDIVFPATDVETEISAEQLQKVIRGAGVLGLPDIVIAGEDNKISIVATNMKNPTTDNYIIELEGQAPYDFAAVFKAEHIFKLLPKNYKVSLTKKGIGRFVSDDLLYYIAVESTDSFYGEK